MSRASSTRSGPSPVLKVSGSRSSSAEAEAIKEAKAASVRFCHPTMKQQYRAMASMHYIDDFLFRGYEYLTAYLAYQATDHPHPTTNTDNRVTYMYRWSRWPPLVLWSWMKLQ